MKVTDVSAFVGDYPFRRLDHATCDWLLSEMDRLDIERAWIGHLSSVWYKDPAPGNAELVRVVSRHGARLKPLPVIHPGLPHWADDLNHALAHDAPAVRAYPMHHGLAPDGGAMRVLAAAAGAAGVPLVLTVRFEDVRQRHPVDVVPDLPAGAVRALVRSDPEVRIIVTHADRSFVEEVHFGLTPDEATRLLWEISWIWGPPENHLAHVLRTVGHDRFIFGTGMPLRIPDAVMAKLDLLELHDDQRSAILGGNLANWHS